MGAVSVVGLAGTTSIDGATGACPLTTLCLLGSPAVLREAELAALALRPKELALLVKLALTDAAVPRVELANAIFGDADDPRGALRWHLSSLRSKLPVEVRDAIVADREVIHLSAETDVARFRRGTEVLLTGTVDESAAETLALYRGDLVAGLTVSASPSFDTWLYIEQESLRRLFRRLTVMFAGWATNAAAEVDPRAALLRLIEVDPYFEDGHVLLIHANDVHGEPDTARAAYDVYQRIVRIELHAEPRPELVRRYEDAPRAGRPLPREELIPLQAITMHVVDWMGAQPTIVAVHGSAGSAYSFTALAERLSPAVRFVAMDLRGHGLSDKPPSGYDLASHVEDLLDLLDAMEVARPAILGFSLGGAVAAALAHRCDARSLVLLEAAIGDRAFLQGRVPKAIVPTGETLEMTFKGFDEYLAAWRAENPSYSEEAERWLDRFARYELAPLPDGRYRRRGLRAALHAEWQSVVECDSLALLGEVRCPVLVVRATQPWIMDEAWFTDEIVAAQLAACRHGTLFVAGRSNHATLIRDPEPALVGAIRDFVSAHR